MLNSTETAYDEVPYPSAIYPQTHPNRLATLATLFGMKPAPIDRCRVLELGCGDGSNLIAMAFGLPKSEFVGIDLAKRAIAKGKTIIEQLDLKNISLDQLNLMQLDSGIGHFDFIIAHGLYSWVPAEARDKILSICSRHLNDRGVAYLSYNAYPGNHMRDMVRGMMRYHAAHFRKPEEQVRQARALLSFLAEAKNEPDVYSAVIGRELERTLKYLDGGFFHDDLSPINFPVYFHEFIEHASHHGLQYLAEADVTDLEILDVKKENFSPKVAATLAELDSGDVIAREQYLDFLHCRAFRQTLLCHGGVQLDRIPKPERVWDLFVNADVRPQSQSPDIGSFSAELFEGPKGAEIETSRPIVKAALMRLGMIWPRSASFQELMEVIRSQSGYDKDAINADGENGSQELGNALLRAYAAGFAEFCVHLPGFVTEVSERPMASPLARLQLQYGNIVSTMRHNTLKIEDNLGRHLVMLLDGTRDRAALVEDLGKLVRAGAVVVLFEGKPVRNIQAAMKSLADELEKNLNSLARSAILVA